MEIKRTTPTIWEKLNESDRQNKRRLKRKIEQISLYPYMKKNQKLETESQKYDVLKIGLLAPRPVLNKRIDLRVDFRIDQGMVEEAENLYKKGLSLKRMRELGLEYGVLAELLEGKLDLNQLREKLKVKIHQYAKRQMTWFKKEKGIYWFDVTEDSWKEKVEKRVLDWYNA